jgi:hypothetical protein
LDALVNVVEQIAHSRMLFQQSSEARRITGDEPAWGRY